MSLIFHIYTRDGVAYIPAVAQTDAGFYVDVDPVHVVPLADYLNLAAFIGATIEAGNPKIKTPSREKLSVPAVLKHTKLKTWRQFEKGMRSWGIEAKEGAWILTPYRRRADGRGFEEDTGRAVSLGRELAAGEIAKRVVEVIVADLTP